MAGMIGAEVKPEKMFWWQSEQLTAWELDVPKLLPTRRYFIGWIVSLLLVLT